MHYCTISSDVQSPPEESGFQCWIFLCSYSTCSLCFHFPVHASAPALLQPAGPRELTLLWSAARDRAVTNPGTRMGVGGRHCPVETETFGQAPPGTSSTGSRGRQLGLLSRHADLAGRPKPRAVPGAQPSTAQPPSGKSTLPSAAQPGRWAGNSHAAQHCCPIPLGQPLPALPCCPTRGKPRPSLRTPCPSCLVRKEPIFIFRKIPEIARHGGEFDIFCLITRIQLQWKQ